jgi:hypothetical protein
LPEEMTCPLKTDLHVELEGWIEGRQGDAQEKVFMGAEPAFKTLDNRYDPILITKLKSSHIQTISMPLGLKNSSRSRR